MKRTDLATRTGVWRIALASLALAVCLMPQPAAAQAVSGTILGTVRDGTGAAIPGASVTVTNAATGLTRTVISSSVGEYSAPQVPTGNYTVTAELTGFKTMTIANVHVGVDQKVKADLKLEVGTVSETITIESEATLVQASSSELGTTVVEEQIERLPLNGRNFVNLTRTVPGVLRSVPGAKHRRGRQPGVARQRRLLR